MVNNKGIGLTTLILYLVAIATVIVLSTIFFLGDGALYNRLKQIVPRADIDLDRDYYDTPDHLQRPAQEAAVGTLDALAEAIENLANDPEDTCFHFLPAETFTEGLGEDYQIAISKQGEELSLDLLSLKQQQENTQGTAWSSVFYLPLQTDVQPCLVYGERQAKAFHDDWLGAQATKDTRNGRSDHYQDYNDLLLSKNEIIIGTLDNQQTTLEWETENYRGKPGPYVLYKHDDRLCLFPTADGWWSCEVRGGVLDDDCFQPVQDTIYDHAYPRWDKEEGSCTTKGGESQ